jgi:hypothetical protein
LVHARRDSNVFWDFVLAGIAATAVGVAALTASDYAFYGQWAETE